MMIRFRLYDIEFCFRFGFFVIPAIILCLENGSCFFPALLAYFIHESGHIIAAFFCGMHISSIRFGALGIHMLGDIQSVSFLRRAAVSLAGPIANLLACIFLLPFGTAWYAAEALLFVFHILPAVPLDGGSALYCVLCSGFNEKTAAGWCTGISAITAFLLGVLGFSLLIQSNGNFTLLLAAVYIVFYIFQKQRGDLC